MNCWLQVHKSEVRWNTQKTSQECREDSIWRQTYKEGPNDMLNQLIFRRAPKILRGAHEECTNRRWAPKASEWCVVEPLVWSTPYWARSGPTFSRRLPPLPYTYFTWDSTTSWMHPQIRPWKGYIGRRRRAPTQHTTREAKSSTPRRSPTSIMLRNRERVKGNSEGRRPVGALLRPCTSTDDSFLK